MRKLIVLSLLLCACNEVNFPTNPDTTTQSTNNSAKIEFRVTGNATGVRVRVSNAQDGSFQALTTMPYSTSITTKDQSMFVSLDATPTGYSALTLFPFLAVQIFADGKIFREASSNEFLLNTVAVSGTWRRDATSQARSQIQEN